MEGASQFNELIILCLLLARAATRGGLPVYDVDSKTLLKTQTASVPAAAR